MTFSFRFVAGYEFNQIASIAEGVRAGGDEPIDAGDTNHNGLNEIIFRAYREDIGKNVIEIYEYRDSSKYEEVRVDTMEFYFGGIYDMDKDNLSDLVGTTSKEPWNVYWVQTRESPTYNDYPSVVSWEAKRDSVDVFSVYLLTDFDQDGRNEIWLRTRPDFEVYENVGNNNNALVLTKFIGTSSGYPCDDFDGDGKMEFSSWTWQDTEPWPTVVHTYESSRDVAFEETWRDTIYMTNGHDLCSGKDCDGDGKPEFFVNFDTPIGMYVFMAYLVQYEAIGNNLYKRVVLDSFPHSGSSISRQSDCGDVDGDGAEEIVWSLGTDVIVLKATGNDQYERVWHWKNDLGDYNQSAHALCYDLNKNGYDEIVLSGEGTTHIYEIDTHSIQEAQSPSGKPLITHLYQNYPNPFNYKTTIKYQIAGIADKLSLKIYDASGRMVKQFNHLTIQMQSIGGAKRHQPFNQTIWDGRDNQGCPLSSGIYFCELVTSNQVHTQRFTKKLVLQK